MTKNQLRIAVLALAAGTLAPATAVLAGGWFSELDDAKAVSLGEILRDPRAFVDVEVKVNVYFHTTGRSYNPYFTRFTDAMYGNFSAWPHNARLYEKRDFQRSYPFFFMQRSAKSWRTLSGLPRVTAIEMVVAVRDVFRGQPWIEVLEFRKTSSGLTEEQVRNVVAGDAHYLAGRYDVAADHYGRAASLNQPETVRADLFHRLGDAQFQTGRYEAATASYREALRADPENAMIQRNVEVSAETAKRARDRKLAKDAVVTDTPSRHTDSATVGADRRNDVDDIIAAFEDPAVVEADVAKERLVLEQRGAEAREAARVAAVAGTTPTETVEETVPGTTPTTPAEGCGAAVTEPATPEAETAVVEEEPAPAPPDDPTSAEGCACTPQTPEEADAVETTEEVATEEETATDETVTEVTAAEETTTEEVATEETVTEETTTEETTIDEETVTEEATDGCATETGCEETVAEGCACEPCVAEEDGCGCEMDATEGEETVASGCEVGVPSDPRVVQVSGVRVWVPRLPFFGCEEVTLEQHRAVIEEVLRTPEE